MIKPVSRQFTEAIDWDYELPLARHGIIVAAFINFRNATTNAKTAPTTSENLTISLKPEAGSDYETEIHSVDPSTDSETDIHWIPDAAIPLNSGDKLNISYTNSDNRKVSITLKAFDSSEF